MASNLLDHDLDEILRDVTTGADETLYVVNPTVAALETFVDDGIDSDYDVTARVFADAETFKRVFDDFIVASRAADLVDQGRLELAVLEDGPSNSIVVTDDRVVTLVDAGDRYGALVTDDEQFVADAVEGYGTSWAEADPYSLRTPPISAVRETLGTDLADATREDFEGVLGSLETARGDGEGLDEVTISLLVAAKNEELLYDVSKWGEEVGIASKATFSRTKTELEESGLIDTEKVPIDVGRPRLRLKLGDERLQGADQAQLASVAQSLLN